MFQGIALLEFLHQDPVSPELLEHINSVSYTYITISSPKQ